MSVGFVGAVAGIAVVQHCVQAVHPGMCWQKGVKGGKDGGGVWKRGGGGGKEEG